MADTAQAGETDSDAATLVMGGLSSEGGAMETEAALAGNTDATAAQPKPPHEVEDFFKGWVLPKLDAVEDKKHVSQFIPIDGFWKVWAPRRYTTQ